MSSGQQSQTMRQRWATARKPDQTEASVFRSLASEYILAGYNLPNPRAPMQACPSKAPVIFVIDDEFHAHKRIRRFLAKRGMIVEDHVTLEAVLEAHRLHQLSETGSWPPAIVINGQGDASISVQLLLAGTMDIIAKPIGPSKLLSSVKRALEQVSDRSRPTAWRPNSDRASRLTPRQIQVMEMVLAGHPSKNIAADLGISQRTVENHRASIMKKTGAKSLPALTRLAFGGV
jgi:two-component system CheB/CheR fusion protein